jgi:putative toxin-antitoxin system antitoxin component (TIGR02293 family)
MLMPKDTTAKRFNMKVSSIAVKSKDLFGLIDQIKEGLPISSFDRLREKFMLSERALSDTIDISKRTLARRKTSGRLSASESERLVRLGKLFDKATQVFGNDEANAAKWFKAAARGLGGNTPLAMADTELGAQEVHALLTRIEHGVFPG